jgi:hypothetical protein
VISSHRWPTTVGIALSIIYGGQRDTGAIVTPFSERVGVSKKPRVIQSSDCDPCWDFRIWLEVEPEVAVGRDLDAEGIEESTRVRRERYGPAVDIYIAEVDLNSKSDHRQQRLLTSPNLVVNLGLTGSIDRSVPELRVEVTDSTT